MPAAFPHLAAIGPVDLSESGTAHSPLASHPLPTDPADWPGVWHSNHEEAECFGAYTQAHPVESETPAQSSVSPGGHPEGSL